MSKRPLRPQRKGTARAGTGCGHDHGISLEAASTALKESGFKITKPRLSLLKAIIHQHGPFTTEEIYHETLKAWRGTKLDLVTVYRSLTTFADVRLLDRVDLGDGIVRYEMRDPSGTHHHHFICRSCERVEPLKDCEVSHQEAVLARAGYTQLTHRLEFFGLCPKCSAGA